MTIPTEEFAKHTKTKMHTHGIEFVEREAEFVDSYLIMHLGMYSFVSPVSQFPKIC